MESGKGEELVKVLMSIKRCVTYVKPPEKLTRGDFFLLSAIYKESKGSHDVSVQVSKLSSYLELSSSAISQLLSHLENKGYISRSVDAHDRRAVCASLTDKGMECIKKHHNIMGNFIQDIMKTFTNEETDELIRLLNKVADSVKETVKNENYKKEI